MGAVCGLRQADGLWLPTPPSGGPIMVATSLVFRVACLTQGRAVLVGARGSEGQAEAWPRRVFTGSTAGSLSLWWEPPPKSHQFVYSDFFL